MKNHHPAKTYFFTISTEIINNNDLKNIANLLNNAKFKVPDSDIKQTAV